MKRKLKIGVDVDGVLREMDKTMMKIFKRLHPASVKSDIVSGWDFPNVDLPQKRKMDIMFKHFPKEVFEHSPVFENAHKEFLKLKKWAEDNNAKLVCATTQDESLINHTLIWLGKHEFNFDEIYVTDKKHDLPIDFLIDDSPKNYDKWVKAGRKPINFLLMDRDYNKDVKAPTRVTSLVDSIESLKVLMVRKRLVDKFLNK